MMKLTSFIFITSACLLFVIINVTLLSSYFTLHFSSQGQFNTTQAQGFTKKINVNEEQLQGDTTPMQGEMVHPCQTTGYQLPPFLKKPKCPEQYSFIFNYGQFNNELRSIIVAIILSSAANRTFVITDDLGYDFSSLINTTDMCVVQMSNEQIHSLNSIESKPNVVPCLDWGQIGQGYHCPSSHEGFALRTHTFNIQTYPEFEYPNVYCIAPKLPSFPQDPLITFSRVFFTGVPKSTYLFVLDHIDFLDTTLRETEKFITNILQSKEYVGLHVRGLDGVCGHASHTYFGPNYTDDYLKSCSMSWEFVSDKIQKQGYDPNTIPIFLASDNQRPEITNELQTHPNVHRWEGDESLMMDMCLLSKSSLFIGVPTSSMSFHIALLREKYGYSSKTNILTMYRETGYLHHLFME